MPRPPPISHSDHHENYKYLEDQALAFQREADTAVKRAEAAEKRAEEAEQWARSLSDDNKSLQDKTIQLESQLGATRPTADEARQMAQDHRVKQSEILRRLSDLEGILLSQVQSELRAAANIQTSVLSSIERLIRSELSRNSCLLQTETGELLLEEMKEMRSQLTQKAASVQVSGELEGRLSRMEKAIEQHSRALKA